MEEMMTNEDMKKEKDKYEQMMTDEANEEDIMGTKIKEIIFLEAEDDVVPVFAREADPRNQVNQKSLPFVNYH